MPVTGINLEMWKKMEDYPNMKKTFKPGNKTGLIVLMVIVLACLTAPNLMAMNRLLAENPLLYSGLQKPALAAWDTFVCRVGMVENRITNTTFEKGTGTNDWTILIGDDAAELPSMNWKTPPIYVSNNHMNLYLYYASLRIGYNNMLVHLAGDRASAIDTKSNISDPTAVSLYDTHFSIDDQSTLVPDQLKIGMRVHENTYAWSESYRDDFIIYDFYLVNIKTPADTLDSVFVALHADCDLSTAEGGSDAQAYSRDDKVAYYKDDVTHEYISYMYDSDNPAVPGNDSAGNKTPKESSGFIGSRLLYCPPIVGETEGTRQVGHAWWDWNSDPSSDQEWYGRLADATFLEPPPSPHDYRYLQKLGPFMIPPGDSIRIVFAFGLGDGLASLRANLGWAKTLYDRDWVGPAAPPSPTFTLAPGDRQVVVEWNTVSETVLDPLTGEADFEGYRLWRKTATGNWSLLMDCDKIDSVGQNTGLVHSFVDYNVVNNFQYVYAITSYDKGDPVNGIEMLESGKGVGQRITPGQYSLTPDASRSGIHAVPNPFVIGSPSDWGQTPTKDDPSTDRIVFVNLPENATVRIYTLTGDLLQTLHANRHAEFGWERSVGWNVITDKMQGIVSGLYLFVVSAPGQDDFIGKFAVVR
jgi:hypothetical protein